MWRKALIATVALLLPWSCVSWGSGCNSSCCRSNCWNCNHCTTRNCRRRTLVEEIVASHDDGTDESEVHEHKVEQTQHRALALSCGCQSPSSTYPKYCCSVDGLTCGLGTGFPGVSLVGGFYVIDAVNGKDGEGNSCAGRCDLMNPCPSDKPCCSSHGVCGSDDTYCLDLMPACNYQGYYDYSYSGRQSSAGWCGYGSRNNGRCKSSAHCCSEFGYCDKPGALEFGDHCLMSAIDQYVWKHRSWQTEHYDGFYAYCGEGYIGNGKCEAYGSVREGLLCCSENGYCGNYGNDPYGSPFCATGDSGKSEAPSPAPPPGVNCGTLGYPCALYGSCVNGACVCNTGYYWNGDACQAPAGDCRLIIGKTNAVDIINIAEIRLNDSSGNIITPTGKSISSVYDQWSGIDKCFDNNESTICQTATNDANPTITVSWMCASQITAGTSVTVTNRKDLFY